MAVAVMLSMTDPSALYFGRDHARFNLNAVNLTVAGVYLAVVYCFARRHAAKLIAFGCASVLLAVCGPTTNDVSSFTTRAWDVACRAGSALIPKTAAQAGVASIIAAFGFLGIGAMVSLRHKVPVTTSSTAGPLEPEQPHL